MEGSLNSHLLPREQACEACPALLMSTGWDRQQSPRTPRCVIRVGEKEPPLPANTCTLLNARCQGLGDSPAAAVAGVHSGLGLQGSRQVRRAVELTLA